jgi:hypothetical protein
MNSSITLPKLDLTQTLKSNDKDFSIKSDSDSNVNHEQNELNKFQKLKQFHNITKYEQLVNVPSVASVNNLQDSELNDLLRAIDNLIYLSIEKIHKTDKTFHVEIENFRVQSNQNDTSANNSKIEAVFSEADIEFSNINLKYLNAKFFKTKPEPVPKINPLSIESIVSLDFLRNGLKSGTFQTQKFYTTTFHEQESVLTNTIRESGSIVSGNISNSSRDSLYNKTIYRKSLNNLIPYNEKQDALDHNKRENYKAMASSTNKKLLIFKFLLVLNLHKQCFELKKVNDKELTYTVGINERPQNWSSSDFETLTLEVKSDCILKVKGDTFKKTRHLNAKAIFDRLLRHFLVVLKKDWPEDRLKKYKNTPHQFQHNNSAKNRFKILEESKVIDIRNNQLRIGFRWDGNKFKDLDVLLLINIGIKFQDDLVEARLNESMLHIMNNFVTKNSGGYFQNIEKDLKIADLEKLSKWLKKHLNICFEQYYLVPNLVHYWLLDFTFLKLNFLKCLMFLNCLNPKHPSTAANSQITNTIVISNVTDLLNGTFESEKETQLSSEFNIFKNKKSPIFNFIAALNNKSNLCLLLKVMQLCLNTVVAQNEIANKINDESLSLEIVIVDVILSEIGLNSSSNIWHIDNIFDRIWSCLFRLRKSCMTPILRDPLKIFNNVLPKAMVKQISFQKFSNQVSEYQVPIVLKKSKDKTLDMKSKLKVLLEQREKLVEPEPLIKAFEFGMKNVFSNIMTDDESLFMVHLQSNASQSKENISMNLKYLMRLSVSTSSFSDRPKSTNTLASKSQTSINANGDTK